MAGNQGFPPPPGSPPPSNPYGFTSAPPPAGDGTPGYMQGAPAPQEQGNGMAVAGLVLGIIALVLCWVPFLNWVLGLLGVIFGALGNGKANRIGGKGKGLALAGLITGLIGLILGTVIFVYAMMIAKRQRDYYNDYRYKSYGMSAPVQHDAMQTPDRIG